MTGDVDVIINWGCSLRLIAMMVGNFNHLEKYESMGRIIPYIMENKTCLKPPTRSMMVEVVVSIS
jgi:hypothetical protein